MFAALLEATIDLWLSSISPYDGFEMACPVLQLSHFLGSYVLPHARPGDVGVHVAVFTTLCNVQLQYIVLLARLIAVHV